MKAVVFSGTTEGRRFSKKLAELGVAVTVCVATPLGAEEQGEMAGITVHAGRLQPDAMAALLAGADLCVDATHPYAVDATRNIRAAAVQAGVEYRRLLRAQSPLPPGCAVFETAAQAAEYLAGTEGNILLATGAKELAVFAGLEPARLYPRVLPTPEGIAACEAANVPHRNIIAMQGPFSLALNKALITQFQIRYLITKDGGAAGGFAEISIRKLTNSTDCFFCTGCLSTCMFTAISTYTAMSIFPLMTFNSFIFSTTTFIFLLVCTLRLHPFNTSTVVRWI